MSQRPKRSNNDSLEAAFAKLDETSAKLDTLKASYNETAKEVEGVKKAVTPTPFQGPKSPEAGRYSAQNLDSERPFPLKPPVPRPTPKTKQVMPTRTSGRFYLQIPKAASIEELRAVREKLSQIGRIVDSGRGTASNPTSGWVELAVRDSTSSVLIDQLKAKELEECVEKMIEVEPGEGRLQARQLDLFRQKASSSSDS